MDTFPRHPVIPPQVRCRYVLEGPVIPNLSRWPWMSCSPCFLFRLEFPELKMPWKQTGFPNRAASILGFFPGRVDPITRALGPQVVVKSKGNGTLAISAKSRFVNF